MIASLRRRPPDSASSTDATVRAPQIVWVAAILAAIFAASSGAEPTGTLVWDQVLLVAVAVAFVRSAAAAPAWVLIIAATLGVVFVRDSVWVVPAAMGVLVAIAAVLVVRHRWLPAVAAALSIQGLLRFSDFGFFGLPSLIAGVGIVAVLGFGFAALDGDLRGIIVRAGAAIAVIAAVSSAIGGLVLLSARADVEAGIESARAGVSAARDGEPDEVVAELQDASDSLSKAEGRVNSVLATPLRLIPVASQHLDVVRSAVRYGSDIADQASRSVTEADITEITMRAGSVDLSALAGMQPDLVATADLLEDAAADLTDRRTGWLVRPIGTRVDDLTDELIELVPEARLAADAALVVPGLLGEDEPRRYFVAFGSPAESRELGGFVGSWALLEFDRGSVSLIDSSRIQDLYELTRAKPYLDLTEYPLTYSLRSKPHWWPQNVTGSPQLSTVAAASRELFDGIGDGPIDGFVYVDSVALAALIEITGPIEVDGVDEPITPANSTDFFLDGQYRLTDRDELKADLGDVFGEVFEQLSDTTLPGPERLGQILGPAARQGHLQVATFDDEENAFFRSIKVQRTFGWPVAAADGFAVVQTNGSVSKLDLYLHRDVIYDVEVADDGALRGTVTIVLMSDIPDDAPPLALGKDDPGLNIVQLSLFTPHLVDTAELEGAEAVPAITDEFGYTRAEVEVVLPANEVRTVEFGLRGRIDPDRPYSVSVWHQPLVNTDSLEIRHRGGDGMAQTSTLELTETTIIDLGP